MKYRTRNYRNNQILNIAVGIFWLLLVLAILFAHFTRKAEAQAEPLVRPQFYVFEALPTPTPAQSGKPSKSEVQAYLKEIFGKNWKLAWAVSQAECNYNRPEWPKCKLSWAVEHSIGMFQINIAKNGGVGAKVHWDKIPGDTLLEKQTWLEDWKNNALMAFRISEGGTNWNAWTGFTNGNYKAHL